MYGAAILFLGHPYIESATALSNILSNARTLMLFADSEHLENSIKCSWVEQTLQNEQFFV